MRDSRDMFLEAYDSYAEAIYRHCYFRVFSKAKAEELTQETFLKTWTYLQGGKRVENIRAFLYRVANNLIIDDSRKRKEESLDERLLQEESVWEPASDEHLRLERRTLAHEVLTVLDRLNQEYREVVVLRYVDDLDPSEIAKILGITANNVSVRLHRAIQAVQELLKIEKP